MKPYLFPTLLALASLFLPGCTPPEQEDAGLDTGIPVVYATNYPLAYFAERIAGDLVEVRFPAPAGEDPAFWTPSDEVLLRMQSSDLVILNGASYEKWLEHHSLPDSIVIDTSKAFSGEFIETPGSMHSHGPGESHSHGGIAFTTWMDMQQAIWQAEEIRDGLIRLLADEEPALQDGFSSLADDLDALHAAFREAGQAIGNQPLVASHPVYQYFGRRYALSIQSVHWEPDTLPDQKGQAELKKILSSHPARWMIWEGEPVPEAIALLEDLTLQSIVISPCGNRPATGDWLSVMKENVSQLRSVTKR